MSRKKSPPELHGTPELIAHQPPVAEMAPMPEQVLPTATKSLRPSPTNPRRYRDAAADAEFAESIRTKGVLQPIVARHRADGELEIVFGHRRHEAALNVGLEEVPVIVREMNDVAAAEAQHVENIQRSDVHPMDEAESFDELLKQGYSAEALAERIGKSTGHVYGRLKLLALGPKARQLFYDGDYGSGIALLLARVKDEKVQAAVAASVKEPHPGAVEPMSYRQVAELLRSKYRVVIDGEYDALAEREIEAEWAAASERAATAGAKVLGPKALAETFRWGTPEIDDGSVYAEAESTCALDEKQRPWSKVLGKEGVAKLTLSLARDPQGRPRWLFAKAQAAGAAIEAGLVEDPNAKKKRASSKRERDEVEEQGRRGGADVEKDDPEAERQAKAAERAKAKQKLTEATAEAAHAAAVARAEKPKKGDGKKLALVMAHAALRAHGLFTSSLTRRGLAGAVDIFPKLAKMNEQELYGVTFDCLVGGEVLHVRDGYGEELKAMCQTLGIDLKALEAEQKAALKAE